VTRRTPKEPAVRDELRERRTEDGAAPEAAPKPDGGRADQPKPEALPEAKERLEGEEQPVAEGAEEREHEDEPKDPLAEAQAERDRYLEMAQRAQADFENYRKRTAKDVAATGERAKIGLVRELLPVVDNLERALASAGENDSALADGVRLVLNELQGVFARAGVTAIEPAGDEFDPTVHEALSTRSEDGAEPGVVLDVVEKGYRLGDAVIRPARVVVSA
jgi:molecular chaperone GrpE